MRERLRFALSILGSDLRHSDDWLAAGSKHLSQLVAACATSDRHDGDVLVESVLLRVTSLRTLAARTLAELNAQRVPLLRLPGELLYEILSHAVADEHVKHWMMLGQVCSTMRIFLLNQHDWWGDAVCSWPGFEEELLERAGPTTRLVLSEEDRWSGSFAFMMNHIHRARKLRITDSASIEGLVRTFEDTEQKLPFLEELELDYYSNLPVWRPNFSPSQLLDMLRGCPRLKVLHLRRCVPDFLHAAAPSGVVDFPYMSKLFIADTQNNIRELWRIIAIPVKARLILHFRIPYRSAEGVVSTYFRDDAALVKRHVDGRHVSQLAVDAILSGREMTLGIHFPQTDTYISYVEQLDRPITADEGPRNIFRCVFQCYCSELNLYHITHLTWNAPTFANKEVSDWISILVDLKQLQYLEVKYVSRACCSALVSALPDGRLIVPALKAFALHGSSFFVIGWGTAYGVTAADVLLMLKTRAGCGHSLSSFRIKYPSKNGEADKLTRELETFHPEIRVETIDH